MSNFCLPELPEGKEVIKYPFTPKDGYFYLRKQKLSPLLPYITYHIILLSATEFKSRSLNLVQQSKITSPITLTDDVDMDFWDNFGYIGVKLTKYQDDEDLWIAPDTLANNRINDAMFNQFDTTVTRLENGKTYKVLPQNDNDIGLINIGISNTVGATNALYRGARKDKLVSYKIDPTGDTYIENIPTDRSDNVYKFETSDPVNSWAEVMGGFLVEL